MHRCGKLQELPSSTLINKQTKVIKREGFRYYKIEIEECNLYLIVQRNGVVKTCYLNKKK